MTATASQLASKKCLPCEGGVEPLSAEEARQQVSELKGWSLTADEKAIRKKWTLKDFTAAITFFQEIADVAESENHHPDLHLTGYRNVAVEISTHAIGGLSENDFILAAKIDKIPVALKNSTK
jgi:4a-hydroxytetrahydrobiopterin dehydratase